MISGLSVDTDEFVLPPCAIDTLRRHHALVQVQVDLAAVSHPGLVRERNEDCYMVVRGQRALDVLATSLADADMPRRFNETGFGMLVADGMGGMSAGDVASRLATQTLVALVLDTPDWIMRAGEHENEAILTRMAERYRRVDSAVREEAAVNPRYSGMGTTMTVAYNLGSDLFIGHVGDSRAYLLRGPDFVRLTHDHTLAQGLADRGAISPKELAGHHFRHVLTRYLGGQQPVKTDVGHTRLQERDQILLCTDGLTEMLDEASIASTLRQSKSAEEACDALLDVALKKGGKDNITIVLARYQTSS
jgi:protein phosphatase